MSRDKQIEERNSLSGRVWGGLKRMGSVPARLLAFEEIVRGGRAVGELLMAIRKSQRRDKRFRTLEDGAFDLEATAFLHGMPVWALEDLLRQLQRDRAIGAYVLFGLGWFFFAIWLWKMATTPWEGWKIVPVLEFTPFCVFLFVMAFKNALENYQIRMRRMATALEYLNAPDGFWPK